MSDLTAKFTALETQLTTQNSAILSRLDDIITKLGTINTTLTNNGTFDTTPIVNAISDLRGNAMGITSDTIYSLNKSIWNLAGPAPGAALTDLKSVLQKIVDTLGDPSTTFPQTYTVRQLLAEIKAAWDNGAGITPYNLLDAIYLAITANGLTEADANAILVRLIAQFDTSVIYPTMKDLLLTISQQQAQLAVLAGNPLTTVPADICAAPLVSTGRFFQDTGIVMVAPVTFATWPAAPGGEFTASYDLTMDAYPILHCANWPAYRIYVASKADSFGVITGRGTRYPCNQWITLDIPETGIITGAAFNVDRSSDLKVYICGSGDPILGGCPAAATDPLIPSGWRIPAVGDQFWEMASGYNNGGVTWALDIDVPHATGMSVGDAPSRPAFIITAGVGTADVCAAWTSARASEYLHLQHWQLLAGAWVLVGSTPFRVVGVDGATGSNNVTIYAGEAHAYTITAVYPAGEMPQTPPTATVQISYLPPGWSGS
jgi:hypothetical protein